MFAAAYVVFIVVAGVVLGVVGGLAGSWCSALPAAAAATAGLVVTVRVGAAGTGLAGALGSDWEDQIPPQRRRRMVSRWWLGALPASPEPRLRRDVPFATIPGSDRVLLCDVWQPPADVSQSGVTVVYLHAAPITCWTYAHDDPSLTPPELSGADLRVRAVASLYGQVSLEAMAEHTSQARICHPEDPQPDWTAPPSEALVRLFGHDAARLRLQFMMYGGRCDWLVGGTPSEVPERYAQASALHHVRPDCPPTLLMHGTHDEMAPVAAVRQLEARLQQVAGPVSAVYLPHTDHMFDLIGTRWSPAGRVTGNVLERFLAVIGALDSDAAIRS